MNCLCDVVIPAGGHIPDAYAAAIGTPHRALAPVGAERRPVMQAVVDALRTSGVVGRIVGVAAGPVAASIRGVDRWLPAGESGPDNILRGLAALDNPDAPALVCTSDLPLLTARDVQEFVQGCRADADVSLGIVGAPAYEAAFPDAPRSEWVVLRDAGPVTLSGLFGVRPSLLLRHEGLLSGAFESRKSQWRMARLLGPRLLWHWATGMLTLHALVARGEAMLGGQAQVLRDAPPRCCFDIDTEDDYTYADTCLRQTGRPIGPARPV